MRFTIDGVRKLVAHCSQCSTYRRFYSEDSGPAIWLAGDQGVYLVSNGMPGLPLIQEGRPPLAGQQFVVYAEGISPSDPGWWSQKSIHFGGEEGVDAIPLSEVQALLKAANETHKWLTIDVDESSFTLSLE